jgi:hypothetical protein
MQFNYVWVSLSPQLWSFGSFPCSHTNLSAQTEDSMVPVPRFNTTEGFLKLA